MTLIHPVSAGVSRALCGWTGRAGVIRRSRLAPLGAPTRFAAGTRRSVSRSPARPIRAYPALQLSARWPSKTCPKRGAGDEHSVTPLIEAGPPTSWRKLEERVAEILDECGYDVEIQKNATLARGNVNIDVWADDHSSPPNIIAVECKYWATPADKNVVHAFRTVVGDSGANTGLIVSSAGFQKGAVEAAAYSNVRLLDWVQFQEMFVTRWFTEYMCPRVTEEADALKEYTEPINSRIVRKASRLPKDRVEQLNALETKYLLLAVTTMAFNPVLLDRRPDGETRLPTLPLRLSTVHPRGSQLVGQVPDELLDAPALRPLMTALVEHSRRATAEFDEVFGERA
jgi:restriction system protein